MNAQPDNRQTPQAAEQIAAEGDQSRQEVARLQAEVVGLKQALTAAQQEAKEKAALAEQWEKDWGKICALLHPLVREIVETEKYGGSIEELIAEIERDMKAQGESGNV
jgi:hypothetical protein